jgi:hypothetical protein
VTGLYVGLDGVRESRFWSSRRIDWGWIRRLDTEPVTRSQRLVPVLNDGATVPSPVVRQTSRAKAAWHGLGDRSLSKAYADPDGYEAMCRQVETRLVEAGSASPVRPVS